MATKAESDGAASVTVVLRISAAAHMAYAGEMEPFCVRNPPGHRAPLRCNIKRKRRVRSANRANHVARQVPADQPLTWSAAATGDIANTIGQRGA